MPTTEFELKKQERDGREAERFLRDLSPIFEELRHDIFRRFSATSVEDRETRETLHYEFTACKKLEDKLKQRVLLGKMANDKLQPREGSLADE